MELEWIEEVAYNKWGHSHGACIYLSSHVSECSCFSVGYISRYLVLLIGNRFWGKKNIFLRKAIIF